MLLEKSQGHILQRFSAAVSPLVEALVASPLQEPELFALQRVQVSDILRYPKGSPELLNLIS